MKQSIRPFENFFTVASLLLFSQGFYTVILGGGIGGDEGDIDSALLRFSFLVIYMITFALLGFRLPVTLAFLKTNPWILFLIGLAIFSVSWSTLPSLAFRKVVALIGSTSFALYLGSRFSFEEQLKLYGWTFGIALFVSFLFALVIPAYGIMPTGAWRGIYPHKNGLGESMFVSFLTFYFLSISRKDHQLLFKICCLLSVVIIVLGQSATALISVLFIFSTAQGLKLISLKSKKSVFLLLLFLIFTILLIFSLMINLNALLGLYDRDITLTGRTPLWASLWEFIQLKPWLGYGYGTFFSNLHRETDIIWQIHDWIPPNSHNGYIHIWLNLGVIGLAVFSLGYFGCVFNSLFKYLISQETHMLWVFLLLLYTIFFNLTEVSFLSSGMLWIISLAAIYSTKISPNKIRSLN
ncbi:MAG: O-antigen ligase family protein [Cyanobacteria bacterium P01_A01_bin.83]